MKLAAVFLMASLIAGVAGASTEALKYDYNPDRRNFTADVGADTKYVYNVYYDDQGAVSDAAFDLKPHVAAQSQPGTLVFDGDLDGYLEQFTSQSVQSHFDFGGFGRMQVNPGGTTAFRLTGDFKSFSDPSPTKTYGRIPRTQMGGGAGLKFKTDKGNTIDVSGRFGMEQFTIPNMVAKNYLDNQLMEATVEYNNAFLPETNWISRATGGFRQFPLKSIYDYSVLGNQSVYVKNDCVYGLLESGFVGRLTEKATVESAVGWMFRAYSYDTKPFPSDNFNGPVFYMRFAEQLTRKDQILVGYNYTVDDSYFTNYVINQEIYLGLIRVIGDQLLLMGRTAYEYRSYSLPLRRDDERITAGVSAKYSLSNSVKLTVDFKMDLLSSDRYDNTDAAFLVSPDRPVSYKAGTFGVGLVASY